MPDRRHHRDTEIAVADRRMEIAGVEFVRLSCASLNMENITAPPDQVVVKLALKLGKMYYLVRLSCHTSEI